MGSFGEWIQSSLQRFGETCAAHPMTTILMVGLFVLTVTLFVLMRTRLGQIKPLWTCAALSILAHLLLMGYFYATKLMAPFRRLRTWFVSS